MKLFRGLLTLAVTFSAAGVALAGTDAAAFINRGVGARAMAMGGAFTSVCDDASALYWNPAGMGKLNKYSITTMSQSLGAAKWDSLETVTPKYQYAGITFPVNSFSVPGIGNDTNTFGIGVISNKLDKIPYTYLDSSGRIVRKTFEDSENAYFLSWGLPVYSEGDSSVYAGMTFKYITQAFTEITDATASGYDMDFGLLYTVRDMSIGLLIDRGAGMQWANGRLDTAGLMTKLGLSKKFFMTDSLSILGSVDFVQRKSLPVTANTGAELGYAKKLGGKSWSFEGIYLRFGLEGYALEDRYNSASKINETLNICTGLGIEMTFFGYYMQLDYAAGTYSLGDLNRVSLSLYF